MSTPQTNPMTTTFRPGASSLLRRYSLVYWGLVILALLLLLTNLGWTWSLGITATLALLIYNASAWRATLTVDSNGIRIRYPFSVGMAPRQLRWSEVLAVEPGDSDGKLFVVGAQTILTLEPALWQTTTGSQVLRECVANYHPIARYAQCVDARNLQQAQRGNWLLFWLTATLPFGFLGMQTLLIDGTVHTEGSQLLAPLVLCVCILVPPLTFCGLRWTQDPQSVNTIAGVAFVISAYAAMAGLVWCHHLTVSQQYLESERYFLESNYSDQRWETSDRNYRLIIHKDDNEHFVFTTKGTAVQLPMLVGPFDIRDMPASTLSMLVQPARH